MKEKCYALWGWKDIVLKERTPYYLHNARSIPTINYHGSSLIQSLNTVSNNFFWTVTRSLWEGNVYKYPCTHTLSHTHIHMKERLREKDYTYICIHLSPNDCKESFNSRYIMVHLPGVFQNGSIITSHVCSLLNYLSLFPGGKRQGGRQLIQCKWKAFEAPYGEDVITVRQLIT